MNRKQFMLDIAKELNSPFRKLYPEDFKYITRKVLTSDNFSHILNRLRALYDIRRETIEHGKVYRLTINNMLVITYCVDCRDFVYAHTTTLYEEIIVIQGIKINDEFRRGKGFGTEFINQLFSTTKSVEPRISYVVFPYLKPEETERNIRLGKWYIHKLGFQPLRGEIRPAKKPHIEMGLEATYNAGIRPLGWCCDWENPKLLKQMLEDPQNYTPLQKAYYSDVQNQAPMV